MPSTKPSSKKMHSSKASKKSSSSTTHSSQKKQPSHQSSNTHSSHQKEQSSYQSSNTHSSHSETMNRWIKETPRQEPWNAYTAQHASNASEKSQETGGAEYYDFEGNEAWVLDDAERSHN